MISVRNTLTTLAAIAALSGCFGQPDDGPPPLVKTQETVNAQIEKIRQDPNMTAEAKEGAIRAIQSSFEASQRQAEKLKNAPKK